MQNWIRVHENGPDYVEALNGVMWYDAPLPRWWHHCKVQTRGQFGLNYTERCACGATRFNHSAWLDKNQTRKYQQNK